MQRDPKEIVPLPVSEIARPPELRVLEQQRTRLANPHPHMPAHERPLSRVFILKKSAVADMTAGLEAVLRRRRPAKAADEQSNLQNPHFSTIANA
jgi:hypothetical protein